MIFSSCSSGQGQLLFWIALNYVVYFDNYVQYDYIKFYYFLGGSNLFPLCTAKVSCLQLLQTLDESNPDKIYPEFKVENSIIFRALNLRLGYLHLRIIQKDEFMKHYGTTVCKRGEIKAVYVLN